MTRATRLLTRSMLALIVGFGLSAAGLVLAIPAHAATKDVQASTDNFRSGGCSGCFFTQTEAMLANFQTVTRVFRGCETGSAIVDDGTGCAGAATIGGNAHLMDFIVIQGDLKDSNTDPAGLGVPGGEQDVTYRVSATGSFRGLRCANGDTDPTTASLGFLAPEGLDGIPNTADDAGGTGTFGQTGVPANWLTSPTTTTAVPLVACNSGIQSFVASLDPTEQPTFAGASELCVVQYDADGNGDINNKSDGLPVGSARAETTDLRLTCDMGFGDLPPQDFQSSTFNTQSFANQSTVGAEIFKIVANSSVHPQADPTGTTKIELQLPQIEGLFGGVNLGKDACTWNAVGGVVTGDASGNIKVCFRENGSGSRETFRNSFMRLAQTSHVQGATNGSFTCNAFDENTGGTSYTKTFQQNDTNQDEASCVGGTIGAVGYVNAARTEPNMYSVPVFGVDPDTANLRTLVKCGMYPYWGPLTGGTGIHAGATPLSKPEVAAHLAALRSGQVFAAGADYLPLGGTQTGVAFSKPQTAAAYNVKFTPTAGECPGTIPAPGPIQ